MAGSTNLEFSVRELATTDGEVPSLALPLDTKII
jgi:hypothetical protein